MKSIEDYISSGVLEQFVLDQLPRSEAHEVRHMAERHPEVRQEIALIEDTLQRVAEEVAMIPPPGLLDRIQSQVTEMETETTDDAEASLPVKETIAKKTKKIHYWQYGVAATFTLKVAFMAVAAHFWMNWQNTESKLDNMQARYNQLAQDSRQLSQTLMTISDPAVRTIVLQGQTTDANSRVLTYWNQQTEELLVNTASLPPNEPDQQYQLWAIADNNPTSLGVFNVSADASLPQIVSFSELTAFSTISVSVEPKGGSRSPSSVRWSGEVAK